MKSKEVNFEDIIDVLREKLENGGSVTFTPHGRSMEPMLRDGMDTVVLEKPQGRLRFNDVALYRRDDGHYVLHRVIGFDKDGGYVFCGDNQFVREHGINDEAVIAVVVSFSRRGRNYKVTSPKYRFYCNFWYYTRFIRRIYRSCKAKFKYRK